MKIFKKFLLLFTIILLTGCTIVNINTKDYKKNIDTILSNNKIYTNKNAIGFQYYLPNGVSDIEVNENNIKLISSSDVYYMYADLVSYYFLVDYGYEIDENAFISEELRYGDKYGYLEVNEDKGKYFIEMMFNYVKIESYVPKKHLYDALNNMSLILSSIKFNNDTVENLLGEKKNSLSENESYNIFETKKTNNDNFLKYDEEYGTYDGDEAKDLIEKKEINRDKDN